MSKRAEEVDFEVLPPARDRTDLSRLVAWILDDLIPIPGTKHRIGLDPLIGLLPGFGDSSTAAFASVILIHALRAGVPRIVLARMALNVLVNALVGAIPVAGDVFSAWFKSNQRNYALLQRHVGSPRVSTKADWFFVFALIAFVLAIAVGTSLLAGYILVQLFRFLGNA